MPLRFEVPSAATRSSRLIPLVLFLAACSASTDPSETDDAATPDAAVDASGSIDTDAGSDAGVDAGSDAGVDSEADAGVDAGPLGNDGLPIGSPCVLPSECATPTRPACLSDLRPLAPAAAAGASPEIAYVGLTFPNGYCSSVANCDDDADCDSGGGCWKPFAEVQGDVVDSLELTLTVPPGTLDYLVDYGVCLDRCADVDDCLPDQVCAAPLDEFVSLVPGAINDRTYCVTPNPCDACDTNATCVATETTSTCVCSIGYFGDGTSCSPVLPVGSACSSDAMCYGPVGIAACLAEIHPLEGLVPANDPLSQIGLDFPDGYCSQDPNCTVDIQCGSGGACFAPFEQVTLTTWRDVEATFEPPLPQGTLDGLSEFGYCMRRCDDAFDCTSRQTCALPMDELVTSIPGTISTRTFCVPEDGCASCAADAFCDTESGSPSCVCRPGFTGNGLTCAATGTSPCLPNPCRHGGSCSEVGFSFACDCVGGFTGRVCQVAP